MILNKAQIDWLTLTTFSEEIAGQWRQYVSEASDKEPKLKRRENYRGFEVSAMGGTWFFGHGKQKGTDHFMMQVSGQAAEGCFSRFGGDVVHNGARCSRIDIQITIEQPDKWSQVKLIAECEEAGLKPEVKRSSGEYGELITVYTGKRTSGRLNRTYQKEGKNGERWVRFETEFGRNYAHAVAGGLATERATRQEYINGEVGRRRSVDRFMVFSDNGVSKLPKPKRVKSMGKTERWILNTVLPALTRYANSHDRDSEVIDMIREVIK